MATSAAWLEKTLRRKALINAVPLTRSQVEALRRKLPEYVEVGWAPGLGYYLEGIR